MHIRHVCLREFKNNKNAAEIAKKISSIFDLGVIIVFQVLNWFSKFRYGLYVIERHSSDLDQYVLRELMECNQRKSIRELALDLNTSQCTICRHLK